MRQNFELCALVVRLYLGNENSGAERFALSPHLHRRDQAVPAGQAIQEGEFRHAF